jgi:hypothetical protein
LTRGRRAAAFPSCCGCRLKAASSSRRGRPGLRPCASTATASRMPGRLMRRSSSRPRSVCAADAALRSISSSTGPDSFARSSCSHRCVDGRRSFGKPGKPLAPPTRRTHPSPARDARLGHDRDRHPRVLPYRFTAQGGETKRLALPAGDYAIRGSDGRVLAAVERKSLDDLASALSNRMLAFQRSGSPSSRLPLS